MFGFEKGEYTIKEQEREKMTRSLFYKNKILFFNIKEKTNNSHHLRTKYYYGTIQLIL